MSKRVYKKLTIEDVYLFCEELGIKCKSTEYKTVKERLIFVCTQCGEDFERSFDNLRNRKITVCRPCGMIRGGRKQALSYSYVKNFVENESQSECLLLSSTYENIDSRMSFKCRCGEEFSTTFYSFKNKDKRRCDPCGFRVLAESNLTPIEAVEDLVNSAGYTLIKRNHDFGTGEHSLLVKCENDHPAYEVSYHKFRFGRRCPHCSSSSGETQIREFLDRAEVKYIPEYSFKDLIGTGGARLRFDFAVFKENDLHLLVEFDGRQHYEPVEIMGGEKKLEQTRIHDELKNSYCKDKNIKLVRIPYWNFNKIDDILEDILLLT